MLIDTGAVLLGRLVRWAANGLVARSEHRNAQDRDARLVPSEVAKHEAALLQVVAWSLTGRPSFVASAKRVPRSSRASASGGPEVVRRLPRKGRTAGGGAFNHRAH